MDCRVKPGNDERRSVVSGCRQAAGVIRPLVWTKNGSSPSERAAIRPLVRTRQRFVAI